MRRITYLLTSCLAMLAVSMLSLTGCGGAECGEGTVENEDGECVLEAEPTEQCEPGEVVSNGDCVDASTLCDEGTTYEDGMCVADETGEGLTCGANTTEEDGECVADEATECGAGTQLDPNDNTCVVTEDVCTMGTAYSQSHDGCVPTDEVCDEGTYFSEDTGLCHPDASCSPGDVVLEGYCVSPAQELAANSDYTADGNTDPAFDGEPVELSVADQGEMTIFNGTIDGPSDLNEDDELNQHVDYFTFDAEAGDWFEISVRSIGIPNPVFTIYSADEEDHFLYRLSSMGTTRDKMRQIVVPEDGTYNIAVTSEIAYLQGTPLGADDWDYVGTLEHLETPEATEHNIEDENIEGTLGRLDENFFMLEGFDDADNLELTLEETPADAGPAIQVWTSNSPSEFLGEFYSGSMSVDLTDGGDIYVIADWDLLHGYDLDFEISGQGSSTFEDGDEIETTVSADDGDVLEVRQSNADGTLVDVTVTDDAGDDLIETTSLSGGVGTGAIVRYVGVEEGDYTVTIANDSGDDIDEFNSYVDLITPTEISDTTETYSGIAEDADHGEQSYYSLEFDDAATYEAVIEQTGSGNDGSPGAVTLFLYDELGNSVLDYTGATTDMESLTYAFEADTKYILRVGGEGNFGAWDFDYELRFTELMTLEANDELEISMDLDAGDLFDIWQNNLEEASVDVTVTHDDSGDTIADETLSTTDTLSGVVEEDGDHTIVFANTSDDDITEFSYGIEVTTPVEATTFDAEEGDVVRLTQSNDDENHSVTLLVSDEDGVPVAQEFVTTVGEMLVTIEEDGEYTVSYFRAGVDAGEQEISDLEVSVEFATNVEVGDFSADEGDVVEIMEFNSSDPLSLTVEDDSGDTVFEEELGTLDYSIIRYAGLESSGDYTIWYNTFDDDFDASDLDFDIEVITPTSVDDLEDAYSGTAFDGVSDEQHYYAVQLSETTEYEVNVEITGAGNVGSGAGFAKFFIYGPANDLVDYTPTHFTSGTQTLTVTFEADTPYIVRVGGDFAGSGTSVWDYDYELSFTEANGS